MGGNGDGDEEANKTCGGEMTITYRRPPQGGEAIGRLVTAYNCTAEPFFFWRGYLADGATVTFHAHQITEKKEAAEPKEGAK